MDLCCFNRPFDDQVQQKIYLETEAKLFIQDKIKRKFFNLVWSYMLDYENFANPDPEARISIYKWRKLATINIIASNKTLNNANIFHKKGFGVKDSIHIACAIEAKAKYFLTVDKGILKRRMDVDKTRIINPIEFIQMEDKI